VDRLSAGAVPDPHGPVLAHEAAAAAKQQTDDYIRHAAGRSPAEEIAHAKELLDAGTINQGEYDSLKAKALI
jgi:hypothetical protein